MRLTCVSRSHDGNDHRGNDEEDDVRPRRRGNPTASHQSTDDISLSSKWPNPAELNNGKREDDECLNEVTTTLLADGQGVGP